MRLHAEQLQASKRAQQIGEVVLHKELVSEEQTIDVPVAHEEVVIERRTLAADAAEAAAEERIGESQAIHIPVSEERVDVSKRVVTTGEVVIGKRERQETRHFSDTVRREEARLEQQGDIPIIWERGAEQSQTGL